MTTRTGCSAIAVLSLAAAACGPRPSTPPADTAARATRPGIVVLDATAQQRAGIVIEPVRAITRAAHITAPGLIALDETRTARIGSLQEGLVLDIRAEVGTRVRANQLLATMHGHAVHDAWAGYRKAAADRRRLQKELAYATETRGRAQRLYATKSISLQEQQRAEVEEVAAKEQLAMAEAEVVRSIEELEHIGITIDESAAGESMPENTEQIPVKTPLAGVVLERLVTPGTTVTPGTPMFIVSELSSLWAIAEVDESHLGRLQVGRPVEVRVAAYPNARFPGTIAFIADMVNPKTRRITVRATVPNRDGRLKPEMYASVTVGEGEPRRIQVVPRDAVQTVEGREVVFVENTAGEFAARPISVGVDGEEGVEIVDGLAQGERVVVAGSFVLKSELLKAGPEGGE
jgi:cobalt-zinc-cadmium efflux system membrane fusion protein